MPVANESVTVTFAKNDVPVLVTTNVTVTGAPAATRHTRAPYSRHRR
jgi:hypothetical protein